MKNRDMYKRIKPLSQSTIEELIEDMDKPYSNEINAEDKAAMYSYQDLPPEALCCCTGR
jgi:hypothetical protein